jgi:hypothetical protein
VHVAADLWQLSRTDGLIVGFVDTRTLVTIYLCVTKYINNDSLWPYVK